MKVFILLGLWLKFFFCLEIFVLFVICSILEFGLIQQLVLWSVYFDISVSENFWQLNVRFFWKLNVKFFCCDLLQLRYDLKCYVKLVNQLFCCEFDFGGVGLLEILCRL